MCSMNSTAYGQQEIEDILSKVFKIPKSNRPVYEFLFGNLLTSIFHKNYKIPPQSLKHSLSVSVQEDLMPLPSHEDEQPENLSWDTHGLKIRFKLFVLPISLQYPYTLGYVYILSDPKFKLDSIYIPDSPFESPYVGRIVFDIRSGEMLIVTHGGSPNCIGLHSLNVLENHKMQSELITVPAVPYEWPYVPSTILSRVSAAIDTSTPLNVFSPVPSNITNSLWSNSHNNMPDGTYHHYHPKSIGNVDYMFNENGLENSLNALSRYVVGEFVTPKFKIDVLTTDFVNFSSKIALVKNHKLIFDKDNPLTASKVRERFAATYYMSTSPISYDRPLLKQAKLSDGRVDHDLNMSTTDSVISAQHDDIINDDLLSMGLPRDALQLFDDNNNVDTDQLDLDLSIQCNNKNSSNFKILSVADTNSTLSNKHTTINTNNHNTFTPSSSSTPSIPGPFSESSHPPLITSLIPLSSMMPTIPPPIDECSVVSSAQLPMTQSTSTNTINQSAVSHGAVPLAPRNLVMKAVTGSGSVMDKQLGEDCRRIEMLEARRKRNRMSAARSNEKKKLEIEKLRKETEMEKKRLQSLNAKQLSMIRENKRLKAAIAEKSATS